MPPHLNTRCSVYFAAGEDDAGEIIRDIPDINLGEFTAKFFSSSEPTSTFSPVSYVRRHRNGTEMLQETFTVHTGKSFFAVSVIKHWHRLPGEVVGAHSCHCSRGVWIKPAII